MTKITGFDTFDAALGFTLRHPAVTAAVVGARTPEEITADASYLSTPIPDALFEDLLMIAKPLPPESGVKVFVIIEFSVCVRW